MSIKNGLLGSCIVLMAANIILIDYQLFFDESKPSEYHTPSIKPVTIPESQPLLTETITQKELEETVKIATASLTQQLASLNTSPVKASPVIQKTNMSVKEYYIPLGTGSTTSTTWVDVPGAEAYVAPSNYGKITALYFEASPRIPTGNGQVLVRLKNVTDNVSLFESEISREGTSVGLVSSGKVPPPSTTKLYRVQLRSSIGAEVLVENARIKLFVE